MSDQQVAPGWYPDPKMAGTQRYWDGSQWTEHAAPVGPTPQKPVGTFTVARGVALGILAAIAVVLLWVTLSGPSELDCTLNDLEVATGDAPKNTDCP